MRVNFLVNEIAGGWEPTDTRLGGTERGVVEWAEELVKRGHQVLVFYNSREHEDEFGYGGLNGVTYINRRCYFTDDGNGDVVINIKSPEVKPQRFMMGKEGLPHVPTIFYTNDVDADKQDLSTYGAVIHISNWAKDNIPVNNPNVFIVPHGYDETKIYPERKIPKQCLYASSPDRGLDTLLRAWLKVVAAHPDATLLVSYGADGPTIPGVYYLGNVDEEQMNELYRTSDIWCHPANGGELQCIAGLKAQAAACWPVIIPTMALSETVKYGTFSTKENYADDLIKALDSHPLDSHKGPTIKESTDKLLNVVEFVLDGNNSRRPTK